jgi:hypothetical protein
MHLLPMKPQITLGTQGPHMLGHDLGWRYYLATLKMSTQPVHLNPAQVTAVGSISG